MKHRIAFLVLACLMLMARVPIAFTDTQQAPGDNFRVLSGTVATDKGELTVKGKSAIVVIGETKAAEYRVTAEIQLTAKASKGGSEAVVVVLPTDLHDVTKGGAMRVGIGRDAAGRVLKVSTSNAKKPGIGDGPLDFTFWPVDKAKNAKKSDALGEAGIKPRTWQDRWLQLRVDVHERTLTVWLEGLLVKQIERPKGLQGPILIQLVMGDRLRAAETSTSVGNLFMPIDITGPANEKFDKAIGKQRTEVGGVPFDMSRGPLDHLNLRQAQWSGWKADLPWSHETALPAMMHDPRMPLLRVPVADYVAAHVLAVADDDPELAAAFTLRAGRYGRSGNDQDVQYDFYSPVPRRSQAKNVEPGRVLHSPAGPLFHVRVPMDTALAQDIQKFIEIELTKEVRLARRAPDPNRYRYRPLGLPSGVRIAAITLEQSPLQMRVGSKEIGHAFVEPQQPTFQVTLRNITPKVQEYNLTLEATHFDGSTTQTRAKGTVEANATAELSIPVPTNKRGYHDLVVALAGADKKAQLRRQTSFALLPPLPQRAP